MDIKKERPGVLLLTWIAVKRVSVLINCLFIYLFKTDMFFNTSIKTLTCCT